MDEMDEVDVMAQTGNVYVVCSEVPYASVGELVQKKGEAGELFDASSEEAPNVQNN